MQEAQQLLQHDKQRCLGAGLGLRILTMEGVFGQFDVPVAELVPGKGVEHAGRLVELVVVQSGVGGLRSIRKPGQNPAVGTGEPFGQGGFGRKSLQVHQGEAAGVPQLVDEMPVTFDPLHRQLDVASLRGESRQGETEGIRAVIVDHQQRIDNIAAALAHLLSLRVAHQRMEINIAEWHLAHETQAHHHHARHPEEQDVETGHQTGSRIKLLKRCRLVRPAHRGEGPESRGKPGVEHVGFLLHRGRSAVLALRDIFARHRNFSAVLAMPGGNAVSPPDLAADAPVLNIVHPFEVGLFPLFGNDAGASRFHRGNGFLRQRPNLDVPLQAGIGLDNRFAAIAMPHGVVVGLNTFQKPLFFQILHHPLARLIAIQPTVHTGLVVEGRIRIENVEQIQMMAFADFKVVDIMCRRDLQRAGTKLPIHVLIGDNGNLAFRQRQTHHLSHQIAIALILRVYRHRHVAQQGLRTGSGHNQKTIAVHYRVTDVPEETALVLVFHLKIGKRRQAAGAPVDQTVVPVDQALLVKRHKHFPHGTGKPLVHGKALAHPVAGSAQALELGDDLSAGFAPPAPHPLDKGITPYLVTIGSLLGKLLFHHILGGNAGMIGAGHPQHLIAAHPFPAHQNILQGVVQGMADMQHPGYIWWRNNYGVLWFVRVFVRMEKAVFFPETVPSAFNFAGIVTAGEIFVRRHRPCPSLLRRFPEESAGCFVIKKTAAFQHF